MEKPKIRFGKFNSKWKKNKLDEVVDFFDNQRIPIDSGERKDGPYPYYGASGIIDYVDGYIFNGEYVLLAEDGANIILRSSPIAYLSKGKFWLNNHAHIMRMKTGSNEFLIQLLEKQNYEKYNTGTAQPKLNGEVVKNITLYFPSDEEQSVIGSLFSTLDELLASYKDNLANYQSLKTTMLSKMFPKAGQTVPEIRLDGFEDEWEKGTIGEFGSFYYGKSAPKWSVTDEATTPCVRYGELYTKFSTKIDKIYSYTSIPKENLKLSSGNEVLVPRVGENPLDFANCSWLSLKGVAIGEMISVYNTPNNPLFIAYYFNAKMKKEFAKRVEGGSVANLYYTYLENISIAVPSLPEQQAIGTYFSNLDNLINSHQEKIFQLETLKKKLLQDMFI